MVESLEIKKKRKSKGPLSVKKSIKKEHVIRTGYRRKKKKVTHSYKIAIDTVRRERGLEPFVGDQYPKFIYYMGE